MFAQLEAQIMGTLQIIFDQFGWLGVAGLMVFENATGITPSEIILGLAGWFLLAAHQAPLGMIFLGGLWAALGSVIGAMIPYWVARLGGRPVVNRVAGWLRIHPDHITRAETLFNQRGKGVVLFGRMIPGVRTLISIPAGLARMPFLAFVGATFLGAYLWCTLLIGLGFFLGHEWELFSDLFRRYALLAGGAAILLGGIYLIYRKLRLSARLA